MHLQIANPIVAADRHRSLSLCNYLSGKQIRAASSKTQKSRVAAAQVSALTLLSCRLHKFYFENVAKGKTNG